MHGVQGGEPFRYVAMPSRANACEESKNTFDMAHNPVGTPLEGCHDMLVH